VLGIRRSWSSFKQQGRQEELKRYVLRPGNDALIDTDILSWQRAPPESFPETHE